jgi:hypothetical protein
MPKVQTQKDQKKETLMRKIGATRSTRACIILDIADKSISEFLIAGSQYLDIKLIEHPEVDDLWGYDAIITDGLSGVDLVHSVQAGIVPIIPRDHPLIASFREFDPMKFEGNAFIYESVNLYLIFEKLVRYLENIRYAGDKRTLLNNVNKTF